MSIQRYLLSNILVSLALVVLLTLAETYYFLSMEMHFYALLMVLLLLPISGFITFYIVQKSLRNLKKIATEVSNRESHYLDPLNLKDIPQEVLPLVEEVNLLLLRLKEAFEREKRFASDAAHELRTPLAALKTQAQVALQATDPEMQRLALENVVEGVNRSTHLIQQLLTLSRLLSQVDTHFELSSVSLHRIVVDVLADMVPQAINKQVEIEFLPEDQKIILPGNEKALKALLSNLVDNAIRYIPEGGGNITVVIRELEEKAILKITDSGPGIPKEYHNRVFEWFFRVTGNKANGSGLGFAIIEQVVKLHKAEIDISTPSSGVGLEVSISFPLKRTKHSCL